MARRPAPPRARSAAMSCGRLWRPRASPVPCFSPLTQPICRRRVTEREHRDYGQLDAMAGGFSPRGAAAVCLTSMAGVRRLPAHHQDRAAVICHQGRSKNRRIGTVTGKTADGGNRYPCARPMDLRQRTADPATVALIALCLMFVSGVHRLVLICWRIKTPGRFWFGSARY